MILKNSIYVFLVLFTLTGVASAKKTNEFPVGNYKLHFNKEGEVIKPDEYYIYRAERDNADGFKNSAIKNFKKAASYGNTFGVYYTALLYLQEEDYINGHAWLSMIDTKGFPHADNVVDLLKKIEANFSQKQFTDAQELYGQLNEVYGVEPTFARRTAWSESFELTGTHIKGHTPNNLKVVTDRSMNDDFTNQAMGASASTQSIEQADEEYVLEYDMDYRLREGQVTMDEVEVLDAKKSNEPIKD